MTPRTPFDGPLKFAMAATFLTVLLGCGGSGSKSNSTAPGVAVETAPARIEPIANVIRTQGVLYPLQQASISPKITAPVERFYAQRGDRVHRGQLLAVLENRDLAAAAAAAQGSYDQARANYGSATSSTLPEEIQTAHLNLENTKSNLNAEQQLYRSEQQLYKQGAIARKQLDATQVALTAARSAYDTAQKHLKNLQSTGESQQRAAAKGQLEAAHGQYLGAAAKLSYTEIRSPIDGVLADRAVYPGDITPAGTPLLIVVNTSKVIARVHVPESQAVQVKVGDAATLAVAGLPGKFPAKVTVVSPALDPNSTTVEIWVEANNPKASLKPGGTVTVSITAQTIPNAVVIPAAAVLTGADGKTSVMIVGPDSRAYSQSVKTGIEQGALVQIVSGLHAGEQVIVSGEYGLPDKTRVKASPAAGAESAGA